MAFKPSPEGETEVHSGLSLCEVILIFWICNHQLYETESPTQWSDNMGFRRNWWLSQHLFFLLTKFTYLWKYLEYTKSNTFASVRKFHHCVSHTIFNWCFVLSMPHISRSCKGTKLTLLSSLMPVSVLHNKHSNASIKSHIIHKMPTQWVG